MSEMNLYDIIGHHPDRDWVDPIVNSKEFICPKCSGKYFGVYCDPKGVKPDWSIVKCHDQHEIGCKWRGTWDDIKPK